MSKQSSIRHSIKSLGRSQNDKTYSLHYLYQMNAKLENEQLEKKKFLEKMKQQRMISEKIGSTINEEISKVQNVGAFFASKIQQQKRKNKMLTNLVQYYQALINTQKKEKNEQATKVKPVSKSPYCTLYQFSKQKGEAKAPKNQQIQQSFRYYCQLQKDYEQLILRNNTSEYELAKKLDEVRTLRSERTVFNKVFDQFENQLFNHELQYRKLVIQRSVLENSFQEKVNQYEMISVKAQKQCQKIIKTHKKKLETQRILFMQQLTSRTYGNSVVNLNRTTENVNQVQYGNKKPDLLFRFQDSKNVPAQKQNRFTFAEQIKLNCNEGEDETKNRFSSEMQSKKTNVDSTELEKTQKRVNLKGFTLSSKNSHSRGYSNMNKSVMKEKSTNQSRRIHFQKKVKDILQDLKVQGVSQIPALVDNLDHKIKIMYRKAEDMYQRIYQQQKFLQENDRKLKQSGKNSLLGMRLNQNLDTLNKNQSQQGQKMHKYIQHKQNLHQKIQETSQNYQKIQTQLRNFCNSELLKLKQIVDIVSILNSINKQQGKQAKKHQIQITNNMNQNAKSQNLQQADILTIMSKLQEQINKIILVKKLDYTFVNEPISRNSHGFNQTENSLSNKQNSSSNKNNESKRDTHKSAESQNILLNLSTNSYFFKDFENRERRTKQKSKFKNNLEMGEQLGNENQFDQGKLELVLKANRTTHNNTTIYSQHELIQISKFNLQRIRKRNEPVYSKQSNEPNRTKNNQAKKNQASVQNSKKFE